jgi:hypothetical protein
MKTLVETAKYPRRYLARGGGGKVGEAWGGGRARAFVDAAGAAALSAPAAGKGGKEREREAKTQTNWCVLFKGALARSILRERQPRLRHAADSIWGLAVGGARPPKTKTTDGDEMEQKKKKKKETRE